MPRKAHRSSSGGRVVIEVEGAKEFNDKMARLGDRIYDAEPFMGEVVTLLQIQQADRWHSDPWMPLAQSTKERKESEGGDTDVLVGGEEGSRQRKPGALRRAVTEPGAPGQVHRVTRTSATFGIAAGGHGELFYARFASNVKGRKRKILGMRPTDIKVIKDGFIKYIFGR